MSFTYTISQIFTSNQQNIVMRILDKTELEQSFDVLMFQDSFVVTNEFDSVILNIEVKYGNPVVIAQMIICACEHYIQHEMR